MQAKKGKSFLEKFNCHDKIPWHFPDIGQMVKIPWHFFKIPWQFPDLEKILFFPDFSLTRGNPDNTFGPGIRQQHVSAWTSCLWQCQIFYSKQKTIRFSVA